MYVCTYVYTYVLNIQWNLTNETTSETIQSSLDCEVVLIPMLKVYGFTQYGSSWDWEIVVLFLKWSLCRGG